MSTSAIAVTEGSGKNIWTDQRSVASVNREAQYVLLAEPALPTFAVLPANMSGSSTYTRVYRIELYQLDPAGTAAACRIQVRRLTTAGTGGTGAEVSPFDAADTANTTAMSLPSSKGTEASPGCVWDCAVTLTATTGSGRLTIDFVAQRGKPLIIPSGTSNGIAIKNITGVASATVQITAIITETAWL
jgi:hypothetical protein